LPARCQSCRSLGVGKKPKEHFRCTNGLTILDFVPDMTYGVKAFRRWCQSNADPSPATPRWDLLRNEKLTPFEEGGVTE